ncbi:hypothetical protein [Acidovorax sp.]|uniref:hypothetical protein n=1 Tax=Acidovorax sp. TaxID=1872122 RepID=UPI002601E778|nr:hypothetical protein [Acidovorax sp.]
MKNIALTLASLLALVVHAPHAGAQASCSSDGTAQPVALFERFISADCETCWGDAATPAPSATAGAVVLDWIVPGKTAEDAPLSAAATNDALVRLRSLGRSTPSTTDVHIAAVDALSPSRLRVALGLPFNDYLGTAIAFAPSRPAQKQNTTQGHWRFHLLLVETVPAGTDGTSVPRQLVRNMLESEWHPKDKQAPGKPFPWVETRSMRIAEGAQAERLSLVGWVQDASGRIVAAAQSICR